jgi:hypothetical protein
MTSIFVPEQMDRLAKRQEHPILGFVISGLTIALLAETVWERFGARHQLQEHEPRYHGQGRSR